MAKEKINEAVEKNEVVVNQVSLPVQRDLYVDRKTKQELYEYHVDVNRKSKKFLIKITCIEKDIKLFYILYIIFYYFNKFILR